MGDRSSIAAGERPELELVDVDRRKAASLLVAPATVVVVVVVGPLVTPLLVIPVPVPEALVVVLLMPPPLAPLLPLVAPSIPTSLVIPPRSRSRSRGGEFSPPFLDEDEEEEEEEEDEEDDEAEARKAASLDDPLARTPPTPIPTPDGGVSVPVVANLGVPPSDDIIPVPSPVPSPGPDG